MKYWTQLLFVLLTTSFFTPNLYAACDATLPVVGAREDVLVIVNDNSKDSCEVGKYYAEKRGLGQNNIVHVATRPRHLLNFPEFRNLMDQIIKYMQDNTLKAGAPPAPACVDDGSFYTSPYYCQASVDHLRQYTKIRYLVTTRGVPTRSPIDNSTQSFNSSTSIDNYLSYWLMRYFTVDASLNFSEREKAFGDGRGMRIVDPEKDGELIVGRIDGVSLEATRAMIDRIIEAEKNGLYGKHYGSKFSNAARWYDYSKNELVYGNPDPNIFSPKSPDSWQYQFGVFGEARPECLAYLDSSAGSSAGKAPQHCAVRFSETPPGRASSRTPIVDDALIYLGRLHGQSSGGGSFNTVLNWVRNDSCSVKLCENAADPVACRAASTDVFKEINTQCVGVAEGFIGYNYQSFPVAAMTLWPTGYASSASGGTNGDILFPEVRSDSGQDDNFSLWFRNSDAVSSPLCYSGAVFTGAPDVACRDGYRMEMFPQVSIASQTVNTTTLQQYRVNFWFKGENISNPAVMRVRIRVYEPTANNWVDYGTQTVGTAGLGTTAWTNAEATFTLDPAKHTQADLVFNQVEVYVASDTFVGELGVDNFSVRELVSNAELMTNPTFTDGHKQVSAGDHAAMFLNRLNGVAFWGSLSHHQSGGHSFSTHPQETFIYFMRGLPLGDAVWWGENRNSGILYGDPIYSPAAVRFDYLNATDYAVGPVKLSGSTVNGRDLSVVSTGYEVDYCEGSDFFICDQAGSWIATGISGTGGQEDMPLGVWDASSLASGVYTLRLKVSSSNAINGRSQSLYDYYPVNVYALAGDEDGDGLSNGDEAQIYGTDPTSADTDGDGLTDGAEVLTYKTNPLSADTDGDAIPDAWEVDHGQNPLVNDAAEDLDGDGLSNLEEFNLGTDPSKVDTDNDGLSDFDEVHTYLTSPILADTDGDHVNDGLEIAKGTDPFTAADQDLDGLSDDWEVIYGTAVNVDDALADLDGDGAINILEYLRDTLPNDAASIPVFKTIYVNASNVTGVEDGTAANPFSTLPAGHAAADHGDTILLASGSYPLSGIYFNNTKAVRITGPADRSAEITGLILFNRSIPWGEISSVKLNLAYIYSLSARHVLLENNEILLSRGNLVALDSAVTFKNNVIRNSLTATVGVTIYNNAQVSLINNTIAGFPVGVMVLPVNPADTAATLGIATIRNSIFANTDDFNAPAGSIDIRYSAIGDGEFAGANGNITGDPFFVDAANNDFHLLAGSPAVDAGDPDSSYNIEPAPNGCRINMGAYGNTAAAAVSTDDPDKDGLYAYCEVRAGTDPLHPDTDRDGINDAVDTEPLNQFAPNSNGFNLSVTADFSDPDVQDGIYKVGDKVNIRVWTQGKAGDRSNKIEGEYKLKRNDSTAQEGDMSCNLVQSACVAQIDFAAGSGDYTLRLKTEANDNKYRVNSAITVTP